MPPMDNGQAEMRVTVTGVSYLWGAAAEPTPGAVMAATQILIRQNLTAGTALLPAELPASPAGRPLYGVRLHLQPASAAVQNASMPYGWQQTLVNSGPEDSGLELDLLLAQPTELPIARPMTLLAAPDLQPDWMATYECSPGSTTVPRQILVRLAP